MLCWDGRMPLNIDMYGGKDHIGQVRRRSVVQQCVALCSSLTLVSRARGVFSALVGTLGHELDPSRKRPYVNMHVLIACFKFRGGKQEEVYPSFARLAFS